MSSQDTLNDIKRIKTSHTSSTPLPADSPPHPEETSLSPDDLPFAPFKKYFEQSSSEVNTFDFSASFPSEQEEFYRNYSLQKVDFSFPSSMRLEAHKEDFSTNWYEQHKEFFSQLQPLESGFILRKRYFLEKELGSGGMGQVFLAQDLLFGGQYALKVLRPWVLRNEEVIQNFIREFKMTEKLSHPGIVKTFIIDEDPESKHIFYTMEYVEGITLQEILDRNTSPNGAPPLSLQETLELMKNLTEIIQYAHNQGIVHRDIKPANIILVNGYKELKIVDFGIAKAFKTHPTYHTGRGGTFYYIAPEQLAGGQQVTPASDIFSTGILLYQLLTGDLPVAMAVPPSELNPKLNKNVDDVIRKAIHPRPEQRYPTMKDFIAELEEVLLALMQKTHLPPSQTPSQKPSPQSPVKAPPSSPPKVSPAHSKYTFKTSSGKNLPPKKKRAIRNDPIAPQKKLTKKKKRDKLAPPTSVPRTKKNHSPKVSPHEPPSSSPTPKSKSLKRTNIRVQLTTSFEAHERGITSLSLSPDGKLLASGGEDRKLKIWDASSFFLLHTFEGLGTFEALKWTSDGRFVISGSDDHTIKIWDVYSAQLLQQFQHDAPIKSILLTPDNKYIIAGSEDSLIKIWELHSGKQIACLDEHEGAITSLAIDRWGQFLASGSEDTTIKLWDLTTYRRIHTFEEYWAIVNTLVFLPEENYLLSGANDATIKLWNLQLDEVQTTLRGHEESITALAVANKGQWFLSASTDSVIKVWSFPAHEEQHIVSPHTNTITALCISPDGQWFASASKDKTIKIWETTSF